jgi:hypothetical protein
MLCSERSRSASNTSAFSSIADELGTPYVGTVDLEWGLGQLNAFGYAYQTNDPELIASLPKHRSTSDPRGHWRIPPKGQLQVMVKNPSKSVVKVFLIPYDLREMPPSTRTFLRQKSFVETSSQSQTSSTDGTTPAAVEGPNGGRGPLRYAVHLQFACLPPHAKRPSDSHLDSCGSPILLSPADSILSSVSAENSDRDFSLTSTSVTPVSCVSTASSSSSSNRYYLCKSIRLVFGNRATDSGERLQIVYEMPDGRFPGGSSIPPPPAEPDRRYLPI